MPRPGNEELVIKSLREKLIRRNGYRTTLVALFTKHNPSKLAKIDFILEKYAACYDTVRFTISIWLVMMTVSYYLVIADDHHSSHAIVITSSHCQLSHVIRYEGQEEEVIDSIREKYYDFDTATEATGPLPPPRRTPPTRHAHRFATLLYYTTTTRILHELREAACSTPVRMSTF